MENGLSGLEAIKHPLLQLLKPLGASKSNSDYCRLNPPQLMDLGVA